MHLESDWSLEALESRRLLSGGLRFTPSVSPAAIAVQSMRPHAVASPAAVGDAPGNPTAVNSPQGGIDLSWTGTAPLYEIFRWQSVDPEVQIGTTTGNTFRDTNPNAGENYFYRVAADYGNGLVASSVLVASLPPLTLVRDPANPITVTPNPASPNVGGYLTIRAITNDLGPLSGTQIYVAWGDGQITNLTNDAANFTTYSTGDPLTKGIQARHLYAIGGNFFPYLTLTINGDINSYNASTVALFSDTKNTTLPGGTPPLITSPVHIVSVAGTHVTFSVGAVPATGSPPLTYLWELDQEPSGMLVDYSNNSSDATFTTVIPGPGRFRLIVQPFVGGQVSTSTLNFRVTPQLASLLTVPDAATVPPGGRYKFHAIAFDQFGFPLVKQPRLRWSVLGSTGGKISQDGTYTASSLNLSNDTIQVAAGNAVTGSAVATIPVTIDPTANHWRRPPSSARDLKAELNDNGNIIVSWKPGDSTVQGYLVQVSSDGGPYVPSTILRARETAFLASILSTAPLTLSDSSRYSYRITPFNDAGFGKALTSSTVTEAVDNPSVRVGGELVTGAVIANPDSTATIVLHSVGSSFSVGNPSALPAPYSLQLYASTDGTLQNAFLLSSVSSSSILPDGATSIFTLNSTLPADLPSGRYRLIAAITDLNGNQFRLSGETTRFNHRMHRPR
jgi:hypothetical protein